METPSDATYWEELYRIAKDLKKNDKGFWKSFTELGALVGWLHYRGKCAYCQRELVQEGQLIGGAGTTDHLLPITRFPKLGFKSPFNAAPTCASWNSITGLLDRQTATSEYPNPDELNWETHKMWVSRARTFIAAKRAEATGRFKGEDANWKRALERRNALGPDSATEPFTEPQPRS
jgi:hypothetical protein